ncbi:MAG: molybdopterin-dependent oxidoreductase [Anaerolineaceae bacterium]
MERFNMVTVTIDETKVEVPEGTTVLNAARKAGIEIPTLCDHPQLTPYGGCRLCLVEVEGARTLQPSCTMPVADNMVIHTDTGKTREARKFVLSMIFSERNHFCPYCQVSGGDCELQNAAYDEDMTHWPLQPNWQPFPVDASHPFIIIEHNRCILCRRCVRACGELVGNFTLGIEERGSNSKLIADLGTPLGESTCIGCGTCVQVCPTGAMIDRWSAYQGKEIEVETTQTTCVGCSVGCTMNVLTRDNRLVRIEGDWDAEVNHGLLCEIGRFIPMDDNRERVLTPMVRKDGSLKAATWDEAYQAIAAKLGEKKAVAGFISTRLPIESMYFFKQIFNDGLNAKTTTIFNGNGINTANLAGEAALAASYEDVKNANCVVVVGEDITKDHQVISFFVKRNLPNGSKLITVAKGEDGLDHFAHVTIKNENLCEGIQSIEKQAKTVEILKTSENTVIIFSSHAAECSECTKILVELAKKYHAKLLNTYDGANGKAATVFGLAGNADLNGVNAAYVVLGDEEVSQTFTKSLEKVPFVIVQSSYNSSLTSKADVVLPSFTWLEQEGHYMNLDGKLTSAKAALKAPEGVACNAGILKNVAGKLGLKVSEDWQTVLH